MKKMPFGIAAGSGRDSLFTGCSNQSKESGSGATDGKTKDYFLGCTQSNTIEVLGKKWPQTLRNKMKTLQLKFLK